MLGFIINSPEKRLKGFEAQKGLEEAVFIKISFKEITLIHYRLNNPWKTQLKAQWSEVDFRKEK